MAAAGCCLAGAILTGCSTSLVAGAPDAEWAVRYERRQAPHGIAVWTADATGRVGWAGGATAASGRVDWAGTFDAAVAEAVRAELASVLEMPVEGASASESRVRTRVDLRIGPRTRRIVVDGDPDRLAGLRELLQEAAAGRLTERLGRLPRAGADREAARTSGYQDVPGDGGRSEPGGGGGAAPRADSPPSRR